MTSTLEAGFPSIVTFPDTLPSGGPDGVQPTETRQNDRMGSRILYMDRNAKRVKHEIQEDCRNEREPMLLAEHFASTATDCWQPGRTLAANK